MGDIQSPIFVHGTLSISAESLVFRRDFGYRQNEKYIRILILAWAKILCDSPLSRKPERVVMDFISKLMSTDIKVISKEYSQLSHRLLSESYGTGSSFDSEETYDIDGPSIRPFLKEFEKTPVFREYLHYYRTGDPKTLRYLFTFLRFSKKSKFVDESFGPTALRGWIEVEERLADLRFNEIDLRNLRLIIRSLIDDLDDSFIGARFGPGKVAERKIGHVFDKLSELTLTPRLQYVFRNHRFGLDRSYNYETTGINAVPHNVGPSRTFARIKFVPKDMTKSRTICMEPNAYMYTQQVVKRWIYASMARSTISRFVHLRDQEYNREAALHGSKYLSMDTLDLSSASDSVHIDLVKGIFPKQWLYYMLGTRTDEVELPNGRRTFVKKFAPMGSALCFPVQCIIFTAICLNEYIHYSVGQEESGSYIVTPDDVFRLFSEFIYPRITDGTPFGRRLEPPLVFGDDILCDSRVTGMVVSALTRLGFIPNLDKSFTGSQIVRESCGIYAVSGEDFTPYYYQIPFFTDWEKMGPQHFASLIGAINRCRELGFMQCATFLQSLTHLVFSRRGRIPYVEDSNRFGILTRYKHTVPAFFLRWHENLVDKTKPSYQRFEERTLGIVARSPKGVRKPKQLNEYGFLQWQNSRITLSEPEFFSGSAIRPQETRFTRIWSPV